MACIGILDATVNRRQGFGVQCDLIGCGHLEFQIHHASKVASGEGVCQIQSQRFVRVSDFPSACPELPGCASAGDTEEARQNIEEAIKLYLAPSEIDLPARAKLLEVTIGRTLIAMLDNAPYLSRLRKGPVPSRDNDGADGE